MIKQFLTFNDNFFASLSATWYLSLFTWQSTTVAALLPVIFTIYITTKRVLIKKKRETAITVQSWGIILICYGAYSCLTVYLNDGNNHDYETALKFIFGGLLVQQFSGQRINIKFIIAGAFIGVIATAIASWFSYNGQRLSLIGNSGKWAQSMAILTILLIALAFVMKERKLQISLFLACVAATYLTSFSLQ